MFYIIYKTTQTTTGRYYYGRHMTEDLNDGYRGSGRWVTSVTDKSTLVTEVVSQYDNKDTLHNEETRIIQEHIEDPLCMNWTTDSRGWQESPMKDPDKRDRMIESLKEYYRHNDNHFKGKTHTPETIEVIRQKALERKPESVETRKKKSLAQSGKKKSPETREKMRQAALKREEKKRQINSGS